MCLGSSKGRTKGRGSSYENFTIPTDLLQIGEKFYKNHMGRLFEIIYPGYSEVGFQEYFSFDEALDVFK